MDSEDLRTCWQEVVKTCGVELNKAPPSRKERWRTAKAAAEKVVKALQPITPLEKEACRAWQEARREESTKPSPNLRLVGK